MKNTGSFLSLLGALLVIVAALGSLVSADVKVVWTQEFSSIPGFVIVAVVLAILIAVLGFLSFSTKPRLLGIIILAASFAGIVVGSTLTDIAMLLSICGGIALLMTPAPKPELPKTEEGETPNPS
jgi:hypothetical protein